MKNSIKALLISVMYMAVSIDISTAARFASALRYVKRNAGLGATVGSLYAMAGLQTYSLWNNRTVSKRKVFRPQHTADYAHSEVTGNSDDLAASKRGYYMLAAILMSAHSAMRKKASCETHPEWFVREQDEESRGSASVSCEEEACQSCGSRSCSGSCAYSRDCNA